MKIENLISELQDLQKKFGNLEILAMSNSSPEFADDFEISDEKHKSEIFDNLDSKNEILLIFVG